MSDPDERGREGPNEPERAGAESELGPDPLHSTDGFVARHLWRALLIIIALAIIVGAHTLLDCAGD